MLRSLLLLVLIFVLSGCTALMTRTTPMSCPYIGVRMDWALAGTITVAASILGDGVGYSLGRLLNQEVLERHGRW